MGLKSRFSSDEKEPPPANAPQNAPNDAAVQYEQSSPPAVSQQSSNFRFPQTFGIYHASGSLADYYLAIGKEDPRPIYYISTHTGFL